MKIKDQAAWDRWVAANSSDDYSKCCLDFASAWAEDMEARLDVGATVSDCAQVAFSEVDNRPGFGITGFMYGAVVSMLSQCWEHGEDLRRWHNVDTQIGDEGIKANESGGVLNPAMLSVGKAGD